MRDWSWFKIFVFTQKKIDLIKDLESSDNILLKHGGISYEKFSVCLDESNYPPELDKSHYPPEQSFGFVSRKKKNLSSLSFNFLVNLWTTVDKNGSMTWTVTKNNPVLFQWWNHWPWKHPFSPQHLCTNVRARLSKLETFFHHASLKFWTLKLWLL